MPLVAVHSWILDLFTHFRIQLLAGQVVLVCLLCLKRSFVLGALIAAFASANAYSLGAYLLPAAAAEGPSAVTILTANVLGRNREFGGLLDSIERTMPDVIVIQEYRPHSAKALAPLAKTHPYSLEIPRDDNFGIALFSRHRLIEAKEVDLLGASAVDVRLVIEGKAFRLVGVHLSTPVTRDMTALRQAQLEAIAGLIENAREPIVVVGDFNLTPYSPYFGRFLEQTGLRDALAGNGPSITWPTFFPILGIPIDHCLVSAEWDVVGYERSPAFGSDHYPITVSLR